MKVKVFEIDKFILSSSANKRFVLSIGKTLEFRVRHWLRDNPNVEVKSSAQSCIASGDKVILTIFYTEKKEV